MQNVPYCASEQNAIPYIITSRNNSATRIQEVTIITNTRVPCTETLWLPHIASTETLEGEKHFITERLLEHTIWSTSMTSSGASHLSVVQYMTCEGIRRTDEAVHSGRRRHF
jgi:hypothetical protein